MKVWLQQKWAAARSQLKAPSVALDSVCITQGHLRAHITGEPVPRHFEQVHMSLRLGRDYKSLAIDLQGTAFPDNVLPALGCRSVMSQGGSVPSAPASQTMPWQGAGASCAPDTVVQGRIWPGNQM